VVLVLGSKTCVFPLRSEVGTRVGARTYGQFATSRLDESRLLAVCKVSDVLRCPSSCWVFAFIGVENAFSPFRSGVEARVAHSDALGRS
jgi:hypothetical protein